MTLLDLQGMELESVSDSHDPDKPGDDGDHSGLSLLICAGDDSSFSIVLC
jgi:hypothetical protein